jgi:signal-transduction protein with cAMP-binding, CBS, and nucleotidyltransferase domain
MPPTASVYEIAKSMTAMDIGSIVIVDRERAIGIITEADIVRRLVAGEKDSKKTTAKDIMSSPLIHVTPEMPLTEAMRVMARSDIRRVAVLKNGALAGIITSRDILRWSPELIDVLYESLRMRGGRVPRQPEEEEDELVAYGGICDACGEYSTDLVFEDGRYLCETCRS